MDGSDMGQQRNKIVFSNDTFNGSKRLDDAIFLLWTWLRNTEKDFVIHFNQWSSNLREGFCYQRRVAVIGYQYRLLCI